jgi:L-lactate dehydrogenase complex protein LldF
MGAVMTPLLVGIDKAANLPNASSFCGRCEEVCPMMIPLPRMMRHWREREFEQRLTPPTYRRRLRMWAYFAKRPRLYRKASAFVARALGNLGWRRGRFRRLPLAGSWTRYRDMPAPEGQTFHELWAEQQRR